MRGALHRFLLPAILGLVVLTAAGCSAGASTKPASRTVRVTEKDFRILAPKRVPSGDVTFSVRNKGPEHHELILVRERDRRLPLRGDDLTVDEDGLGSAVVATLEPESPGVHEVKAHLRPGRYWLICNMAGHYMGGMRTQMVVE